MSNKLIYSGKAKDILATDDEDVIVAHYKDQATAFNGVKKEQIVGKEYSIIRFHHLFLKN